MERLKQIVRNELLDITDSLNGFSIFGYNNSQEYDIYIPTKTIEKFYFITYKNGTFYNLYSIPINLSEIEYCKYSTKEIIEKNRSKILHYSDIFIEEHNMLNYIDYQSPQETDAEELLDLGNNAFEIGEYEEASRYYSNAISLKPYDKSFYIRRASCFVKSQQFDYAIADICRTGISNPISKQNIFTFTYEEIGNIYRKSGDYNKAIKYYSIVLNNTGQPWIFHKRAICYKELAEYQLAIKDLEYILAEDREIDVLLDLGEVYLKAGLKFKAKSTFEEVINFSSGMLESIDKPLKEKAVKLLNQMMKK